MTHKFPHSWRWPDDGAEGRGRAWEDGDVSKRDIRPAAEKSRKLDPHGCCLTISNVFYNSHRRVLTSVDFFLFFFSFLTFVVGAAGRWVLSSPQCFVTIGCNDFGVHVSAPAGVPC